MAALEMFGGSLNKQNHAFVVLDHVLFLPCTIRLNLNKDSIFIECFGSYTQHPCQQE